jgi:hypothetical protein
MSEMKTRWDWLQLARMHRVLSKPTEKVSSSPWLAFQVRFLAGARAA